MNKPSLIKTSLPALVLVVLLLTPGLPRAQQAGNNLAPGAPGKDAQWTSAGKEAVGTSNTLESKVWFTLRGGVMDEVYYPTVDVANTRTLQFVVTGCRDGLPEEQRPAPRPVEVTDQQSLSFRQTTESATYKLTKTYTTDPERPVVLIDVEFEGRCRARQSLHVYYDPSLNNSGMHDSAWTEDGALLASDADKASALVASKPFDATTSGYFGTPSDPLGELRERGGLVNRYARAADGNVVQVAEIGGGSRFTLALGFGREPAEALKNARASLAKGFARAKEEYDRGWHEYVRGLRKVEPKHQAQYDMAAMVLKAHEDKTFRGAMIASLSIPWGGGSNANEPNVGGYHLVWSRDLYQVATAFHALGDKASADRALDYLFRVQQKPDGGFPQNSWLDGRPFWGSLQLDEVAYPLVLAYQLGRTDNETYTKHVRPAADFILRHGPYTPQERWEEESGYSPSTIAAEIAGLACAAEIAKRNGDEVGAAVYQSAADDWARNVEAWTATTSGVYGDKNYYLRVTENDDPNDGEPRELNNGAGTFDERQIVDAGFLELVRLGVRPAGDPLIAKSLKVIDQVIKVETPHGPGFYRYNHDGYGEMDDGRPWNWDGKYTGRGRLWALLSGERGQYELARGEREAARRRLETMAGFANAGLMIPEQVWDKPESPRPEFKFGEGTGSATPLAWSSAQFIRLASNLQEGRNLDTPDLVAARYAKQPPPPRANADFFFPDEQALRRLAAGSTMHVRGALHSKGMRAFVVYGGERRELRPDADGRFSFDLAVERGESFAAVAAVSPTGATYFRRVRVRGLSNEEREAEERAELTPSFVERIKAAKTSPLVEGDAATFIFRGMARRVELAGDFTLWAPTGLVLRDLPGTDLKFLTLKFPKDARLEYKLVADGAWLPDPLNPNRNDNGVGGENSYLAMPAYSPAQPAARRDELRGRLEPLAVPGEEKRKVQVYLPPGYAGSSARYPVLYLQDGSNYLALGRAVETADRLIAEGKLAPFVIVLIDPVERMKEYRADDRFADWMAGSLVPLVDARYRTRASREGRALMGASLGGVISVWTALRHPQVFARVGGQSPAFHVDEEKVLVALSRLDEAARQKFPLRFYFDAGRYEPPILETTRRAQLALAARGYPVTYRESPSGHNYTTWRDRLADAYAALWAD